MKIYWVRHYDEHNFSFPTVNERRWWSRSPLCIYRHGRDKTYYVVTAPSRWERFNRNRVDSGPWPTRQAAQAALLIKLHAMGFEL